MRDVHHAAHPTAKARSADFQAHRLHFHGRVGHHSHALAVAVHRPVARLADGQHGRAVLRDDDNGSVFASKLNWLKTGQIEQVNPLRPGS